MRNRYMYNKTSDGTKMKQMDNFINNRIRVECIGNLVARNILDIVYENDATYLFDKVTEYIHIIVHGRHIHTYIPYI